MKFKKDTRDRLWAKLELEIQKRALRKDKRFVLMGGWKKFVRKQGKFKIFEIDGEWIRNNISITFNHGGHGYVHVFIPLNEIWIEKTHHLNCNCKNTIPGQNISKEFFESCVLHEIVEFNEMKKGRDYWHAHQIALDAEIKLGLLKDPFSEI